VFKNDKDKAQIVHLVRQVYPENTSSSHKIYLDVCKYTHSYLFWILHSQSKVYYGSGQKYFPARLQKCLQLFLVMNPLKFQYHFLHVIKDAKPQARRALLTTANDELIKAIVECAINKLNGNYKLSRKGKSKLTRSKSRLHALVNSKISFNS
jgi:hypothetical protein